MPGCERFVALEGVRIRTNFGDQRTLPRSGTRLGHIGKSNPQKPVMVRGQARGRDVTGSLGRCGDRLPVEAEGSKLLVELCEFDSLCPQSWALANSGVVRTGKAYDASRRAAAKPAETPSTWADSRGPTILRSAPGRCNAPSTRFETATRFRVRASPAEVPRASRTGAVGLAAESIRSGILTAHGRRRQRACPEQ